MDTPEQIRAEIRANPHRLQFPANAPPCRCGQSDWEWLKNSHIMICNACFIIHDEGVEVELLILFLKEQYGLTHEDFYPDRPTYLDKYYPGESSPNNPTRR